MLQVVEIINSDTSIKDIDMSYAKITHKGIVKLQSCLEGNTTLERLDFSYCKQITDESVPFFIRIIESSHIETIAISETKITQKNALIGPLAKNKLTYGSKKLDFIQK